MRHALGRWRARRHDPVPQRTRFLVEARRSTPYVAVEVDGAVYLVSTADEGIERDLFLRKRRPELFVLPRAMLAVGHLDPRRSLLIDVGANVGTTTIPALRQFGFSTVVACEPAVESTRLLRANCDLNGLQGRVTVLEAAVSDREGEALLDLTTPSRGTRRLLSPIARARPAAVVRAVTLDALAADGTIDPGNVGLLWIDSQGHEPHVLAGAEAILECRPPVVFSLRPDKYTPNDAATLIDKLASHYDRLVDLRTTKFKDSTWGPDYRPITDLAELLAAGRHTDLLAIHGDALPTPPKCATSD